MNPWHALLAIWLVMVVVMTLGWGWQRMHANAGIVDAIWTSGVGFAAIFIAAIGDGAMLPRGLLAVLGVAWSLRLALHLFRRVLADPHEDGRYRQLRQRWHGDQRKFFAVFQLQALLVPLFALPFLGIAHNPVAGFSIWTALALLVWIGSVVGETIADRQLARFRTDPASAGRTCRAGLWRWSRHPNYFFESCHWFCYALLAIGSPWWWLGWIGPVVMYVFLRWISGVPYTEAQALRNRLDYADYQRTTPMFFPWFPKKTLSKESHA